MQASAIDEVAIAVCQTDEMTQHNAALVEQTNAAIEQTEGQATELDRMVDIFKLGHDAASAAYASAPRAPVPLGKPAPQKAAAGRYFSQGNAAISEDWSEF